MRGMDPSDDYFDLEREVVAYRTAALIALLVLVILAVLTC